MARTRKTPKPKTPSYERIDRTSDQLETYSVLDACLEAYRRDLKTEGCRIALAWRYGLKKNKDGQLMLGKCKKVSELDKQFEGFDFIIILNREAWTNLDASQRRALMHHELCHAAIAEDLNGNVKKDARNRTMFRIRKHDIEEFGEVVEHHGCYKSDLGNFVATAMKSKKPPEASLFGEEPAGAISQVEYVLKSQGEASPEPAANGHAAEPSANGHAGNGHVRAAKRRV